MTPPLLIFLASVAGSLHCVGMCGGFACALGASSPTGSAYFSRQLVYNVGRVCSYGFIGALAGSAGMFLVDLCGEQWAVAGQRVLAIVSGALMVFIGLQFAGMLRHLAPRWPGQLGADFAVALRTLMRAPGLAPPLALGTLNGWLPCPLVYAFAAQAAASGGASAGAQLMLWFGLGTFPAMLLVGAMAWWWPRDAPQRAGTQALLRWTPALKAGQRTPLRAAAIRSWSVRLGAGFIVMLGLLTVARGLWPLGGALHGH
ncbi:MAG: sulfite exporter TauE/SafE family protein [Rubrivivax sp.]|nr:sulfite exporter TauE/SafE family protein [Rubrivivax sp.]